MRNRSIQKMMIKRLILFFRPQYSVGIENKIVIFDRIRRGKMYRKISIQHPNRFLWQR